MPQIFSQKFTGAFLPPGESFLPAPESEMEKQPSTYLEMPISYFPSAQELADISYVPHSLFEAASST